MTPTERFRALVDATNADVALDVGALCIAAHAHPGLDVDEWLARIDDLASGCASATFDAVREELFVVNGYRGAVRQYGDPENSFLDSVIERRRGIPITLSVLVIAVASRIGVVVDPVGMPGHFLVRERGADVWCDPFHRGLLLDEDGCRARFDAIYGGARELALGDLDPTPPRTVLTRMLVNLEQGPLARDPVALVWLSQLHLAIPSIPLAERVAVLRRYARVGDPRDVVAEYDRAANGAAGPYANQLHAEARELRARWN